MSTRPPATPLAQALAMLGRRQRWLAERVGITETYMSEIVTGKYQPSRPLRLAIAAALDLPEAHLF